jgi:hypothetical protein
MSLIRHNIHCKLHTINMDEIRADTSLNTAPGNEIFNNNNPPTPWSKVNTDQFSQNFVKIHNMKLPNTVTNPIIGVVTLKTVLFLLLYNMFRLPRINGKDMNKSNQYSLTSLKRCKDIVHTFSCMPNLDYVRMKQNRFLRHRPLFLTEY